MAGFTLILRFMEDTYHTLAAPSTGSFKDRGSKFLSYAFPIYTEAEGQTRLAEVRKAHLKARHHCYAYRLGLDQNTYRANDDGEPSGTAGRPILGQIDSHGLTNVLIVVVRYFGGTKLGTSGLINAYRQSSIDALEAGEIIQRQVVDRHRLTFENHLMSSVMNALKKLEFDIRQQDFTDLGRIEIATPQSETESALQKLRAAVAKVRQEEWDALEPKPPIPGFHITYLATE